jgi:hypothetical protein
MASVNCVWAVIQLWNLNVQVQKKANLIPFTFHIKFYDSHAKKIQKMQHCGCYHNGFLEYMLRHTHNQVF